MLGSISLLISCKDFLSAALPTYTAPRRSRSIDGSLCALKSATPFHGPLLSYTIHHTMSRRIRANERYARCHDPHEVIEGAKKRYTGREPPYTHEHNYRRSFSILQHCIAGFGIICALGMVFLLLLLLLLHSPYSNCMERIMIPWSLGGFDLRDLLCLA